MASRNMTLAAKSRDAVNKVLMKRHADTDLCLISWEFAANMFRYSTESQELKVKAASILLHILNWGADHGHCSHPTFDYRSLIDEEAMQVHQKEEAAAVAEEATAPVEETASVEAPEEKEEEVPKEEEQHKTKDKKDKAHTGGRACRKVCQIDPKTMEVIKTWGSISEIKAEMGLKSLSGALSKHCRAKGFYWCYAEDAGEFKPARLRGERPKRARKKRKLVKRPLKPADTSTEAEEERAVEEPRKEKPLSAYTDKELIDGLRGRGWKGRISLTITVDL